MLKYYTFSWITAHILYWSDCLKFVKWGIGLQNVTKVIFINLELDMVSYWIFHEEKIKCLCKHISVSQQSITSPRYFVQNMRINLLGYIFLTKMLIFNLVTINLSHRSRHRHHVCGCDLQNSNLWYFLGRFSKFCSLVDEMFRKNGISPIFTNSTNVQEKLFMTSWLVLLSTFIRGQKMLLLFL